MSDSELLRRIAEQEDLIADQSEELRQLDAALQVLVRGNASAQEAYEEARQEARSAQRDLDEQPDQEQDCSDLELENQSLSDELDDQRGLVSELYDQIEVLEDTIAELQAARKPAKKNKKKSRR